MPPSPSPPPPSPPPSLDILYVTPLDVPAAGGIVKIGLSRPPDGTFDCIIGGASTGPATSVSPAVLQCTVPAAPAGSNATVLLTGAWPGTLSYQRVLSFFGPCPGAASGSECSGHGYCYAGTCQCQDNAYGPDCSTIGYAPVIDPASLPATDPLPVPIGRATELALRTVGPGNATTWLITSGPFSARINASTGVLTWTARTANDQVGRQRGEGERPSRLVRHLPCAAFGTQDRFLMCGFD